MQDALNAIKQKMAIAHAPGLRDGWKGDSEVSTLAWLILRTRLLTFNGKPNPDYTGATYEPAPQGGGGLPAAVRCGGRSPQPIKRAAQPDIAKLPHGQPFIIPSGLNQGKIGYAQ